MGYIVLQSFFYKDEFGIKYTGNVYVPLNKETRPHQYYVNS